VKLSQASNKLSRNVAQVYDHTDSVWVSLPFKVMLANSGRWIGRTETFYNRRVILSPHRIDPEYQVIRISGAEYLLFAEQPNIQANDTYLYDYTGLNVEREYADLKGLTPTLVASGISGKKVVSSLGSFPIAMDRFASNPSTLVKDVTQSKLNCYIPTYANASRDHIVEFRGEQYDVKEEYLELNLTHLTLIKR